MLSRRIILLFLVLAMAGAARSQMSDFISLRKMNDRYVASYFKGSPIVFNHVNGQHIEGVIEAIRNDSVFVKQWQVMSYMSNLGTSKVDTTGYFILKMHYQEIRSIESTKKESWRFVKNGSIFMIGGVGYALLNVINGAYLKQPINDPANIRSLGIAAGVAGGGYLLNRLYARKERKGNKYKIVYVKMTGK
jgi:hypothetical protein